MVRPLGLYNVYGCMMLCFRNIMRVTGSVNSLWTCQRMNTGWSQSSSRTKSSWWRGDTGTHDQNRISSHCHVKIHLAPSNSLLDNLNIYEILFKNTKYKDSKYLASSVLISSLFTKLDSWNKETLFTPTKKHTDEWVLLTYVKACQGRDVT